MAVIPQFGNPHGTYADRPGAYGIIGDDAGRLLVVFSRGRCHLPGGGIKQGEDPLSAVIREVNEETGHNVTSLERMGEANQFLETKDIGPVNKLGIYFRGRLEGNPVTKESEHEWRWMSLEEFFSSTAHDFHKWAVKKWFVPL